MIPLIPEYCPTQRLLHLGHDAASHRASLRQDGARRSGTWRRPLQLHPIDCLALARALLSFYMKVQNIKPLIALVLIALGALISFIGDSAQPIICLLARS